MIIRKSTEKDFDKMMEIYKMAREFMAETGNPNQWGPTNWPPEDLIHQDIKEGKDITVSSYLKEEKKYDNKLSDTYGKLAKFREKKYGSIGVDLFSVDNNEPFC